MHATADLLERESELAELELMLEGVLGGAGRCAVIEGAAGIGKTSLLRALRDRAAGAGLRVLTARGGELEQTFPYGVVRQLFEAPVARVSPAERDRLLDGAASLAAPLLTGTRDLEASGQGEDAAFAVVHGLYWLAANLAMEGPLVLAIDDLHWADAASLRWLAYLAHRIEGLPILAIAAVRPLDGEVDPSLASLLADPATVTIRPSPLTHHAAAALLSGRVSVEDFDEVSAAAHQATAGNPLLLRELAGALAHATGATDLVTEVERLAPEVVSRRVRLELAKLGSEATALARAVAVIGEDAVCSECVPELADLDAQQADRAASLLARGEILRHDRPLRFVHPLVRQAVYDASPAAERDAAHARGAELLQKRGAPAERVAAQLLLSPPNGRSETVGLLRDAARGALADGAPDSALSYLRRALDEPPATDQRPDVLLELADTEGRLGLPDAPLHLRDAVQGLEDPARRTRARVALARALFWRSEVEQSAKEAQLALSQNSDPRLRRTLEAEYYSAALRVPSLHASAFASLEELDLGAADTDDEAARMLLALKAYALASQAERRGNVIAWAELALARGIPAVDTPSWSLWAGLSALLWADSFETPFAVVDQAIEDARKRGAAYQFAAVSAVRSSLLHARGSLVEAEADARAGVDALPSGASMIMPFTLGQLAEVLVDRGAHDEAADLLHEAGADADLPEEFSSFALLRARARLRLAQGDPRAAAADAETAGRTAETVGFRNPVNGSWRSDAAFAHVAAGDAAAARPLAAEEHRIATRWGAPRGIGRSLRALGLAEGGKRGLASLEKSVAALASSPALLERAHSLVALGAATRRAGQRAEARAHLREGLDLAQRCGAGRLAEHAHAELIAAGAKPRTKALAGVEALTPSERRVAAMAAEGMGNREIAQALFVTLRTVEMHLSNSFRKLDINSRTQLIDALASTDRAQATV